jgi:hypothetical protein
VLTVITEPPAWYCAGEAPKLVTHRRLPDVPDVCPVRSPPPEGAVQSAAVGLLVFGVPLMNCIHHIGLALLATVGLSPVM